MNSSSNGNSKYHLPRFKRMGFQASADPNLTNNHASPGSNVDPESSTHLNPNESLNSYNHTTSQRNVSSSSSIMSTPSNNIRKVQQQRHDQLHDPQPHQDLPSFRSQNHRKPISTKSLSNLNVKKKLLNLQQSSKRKFPLSSPNGDLANTMDTTVNAVSRPSALAPLATTSVANNDASSQQTRHSHQLNGSGHHGNADSRPYSLNHTNINSSPNHKNVGARNFVLRKPLNINLYDYSVFVKGAESSAAMGDGEESHHHSHHPHHRHQGYNNGENSILEEGPGIHDMMGSDPNVEYQMPPPIKESQLKAWESAEKVTRDLIFDDSSDDDHDDEADDNEDYNENGGNVDATAQPGESQAVDDSVMGSKQSSNAQNSSRNEDPNQSSIQFLRSIPGLSKGELQVVLSYFEQVQKEPRYDPESVEEQESKLLLQYRDKHHQQLFRREGSFGSQQSLLVKRKTQLSQKRDFLHKMFGYNNCLNITHITNNSLHSVFENGKIQKSFHEDREEMTSLFEEDKAHRQALAETMANLNVLKNSSDGINVRRKHNRRPASSAEIDMHDFDYDKFSKITHNRLTNIYHEYFDVDDDVENNGSRNAAGQHPDDSFGELSDANQELQAFTLAYLKRCIRDEIDDTDIATASGGESS